MKAEINRHGKMTIKAETELEAYALSVWIGHNEVLDITNIIFDWSPENDED